MDPDYGIRIRDNFGHDRLKLDQDLPHFFTDNFSRDDPTNDASAQVLDKMYIGRSVIAGFCKHLNALNKNPNPLLFTYILVYIVNIVRNVDFIPE